MPRSATDGMSRQYTFCVHLHPTGGTRRGGCQQIGHRVFHYSPFNELFFTNHPLKSYLSSVDKCVLD